MSEAGQRGKFTSAEAYCLMLYRCEGAEPHDEILWNSRDGVTPFVIKCARCESEMKHENWSKDRRVPDHIPEVGDRIFVNLTMDQAMPGARKHVEQYWDHSEWPLSKTYPGMTREECVGAKAQEWVGDGGNPHVIEVTDKTKAEFRLRANTVEGRRPNWMRSGRHA